MFTPQNCIPKASPAPALRHGLLALAMAFGSAATQAQTTPTGVLARGASGITVTTQDIVSELQRATPAVRKDVLAKPEAIKQLANNLLVRRTLAKESAASGQTTDPVVQASVAIATDRVLSDAQLAWSDAKNAPSPATTEAFALDFYNKNPAKFERPAQTRARHILLDNKGPESVAKAQELLAQLRAGTLFEQVAKQYSTDTSNADKGGDLGYFTAGQMVKPFDDAVNALAKSGDLSEPVVTQFGLHLIRLDERVAKSQKTYAEVKDVLEAEARTVLMNNARVDKVAQLNETFVYDAPAIEAFIKATTP